jgi:hypothetical protein
VILVLKWCLMSETNPDTVQQEAASTSPAPEKFVDRTIDAQPLEIDDPSSPTGKSRVWTRNGIEVSREHITVGNQHGVESVSAGSTVPAGAMPTPPPATNVDTAAPASAVPVTEVSKSGNAEAVASSPARRTTEPTTRRR